MKILEYAKNTNEFVENRDILVRQTEIFDNRLRLYLDVKLENLETIVYSEKETKQQVKSVYEYDSDNAVIDLDIAKVSDVDLSTYYVFAKFEGDNRNYRFMMPNSSDDRVRFSGEYRVNAYFSSNHRLALSVKKHFAFGAFTSNEDGVTTLKTNRLFKKMYVREQNSDLKFEVSATFGVDSITFNDAIFDSLTYGRYELLFDEGNGVLSRLNFYDIHNTMFPGRYFQIAPEVFIYYSINGFLNVWTTQTGKFKPFESVSEVTASVEAGEVQISGMPEIEKLYLTQVNGEREYVEMQKQGDKFILPKLDSFGEFSFIAKTKGGSIRKLVSAELNDRFVKTKFDQVFVFNPDLTVFYPDAILVERVYLDSGVLVVEGIQSEIKTLNLNDEPVEFSLNNGVIKASIPGTTSNVDLAITVEIEDTVKTIISENVSVTPTPMTSNIFGEIRFNIDYGLLEIFFGNPGAYRKRYAKSALGISKILQPDGSQNKIAVILNEKKSMSKVFALSRHDMSLFEIPYVHTTYGIDLLLDKADLPDVVTAYYVMDLFVKFIKDDQLTSSLLQLPASTTLSKKDKTFAYLNVSGQNHYQMEPYLTTDKSLAVRLQNDYYNVNYDLKPVDDEVVLYEAFQGQQIGDSPYAFMRELMEDKRFKSLKHIWALEPGKESVIEFVPTEYQDKISIVTIGSKEYMDALLTAKYLFNTATFPAWFVKKPEQIYVNTWHGTAQKTLGYDMAGGRDVARNQVRNFMMTDFVLSPNQHMTDVFADSYKLRGGFDGKILQGGYPRIDLTFSVDKSNFLKYLIDLGMDISVERPIITVAPTWRGASHLDPTDNSAELIELYRHLSDAFGDRYNILFKVHQLQYNLVKNSPDLQGFLLPDFVNTNQLLGVTDILVTDFSSIFFDYLVTDKPVIFYLPDAENYSVERGYYFDLAELPGPIAKTMGDLKFEILAALTLPMKSEIKTKYNRFKELFTSYDDGSTTDRYINYIFNGLNDKKLDVVDVSEKQKKRIVIYPGSMMNNGITTSFLNLIDLIDYEKIDVTVFIDPQKDKSRLANIEKINQNVRLMYRFGSNSLDYGQRVWDRKFAVTQNPEKMLNSFEKSGYAMDMRRLLPIKFDAAIHFSGYENKAALDIASMDVKNKIIFQHNDLFEDANKVVNGEKKNRNMLLRIFNLYQYFDKIVSVSPTLADINLAKLSKFIKDSQINFARNTINYGKINMMRYANDYVMNLKDSEGQRVSVDPNDVMYLAVGRLSTEKNHLNLIRAFSEFHIKNPASFLYIAGDGAMKNVLQNEINKLEAQSFIKLLGQQNNVYALMQIADFVVLPSLHEGQPVVLLEALAMQKKVIASNILPNVDVIGNEKYGMLTSGVGYLDIKNSLIRANNWDLETETIDVQKYNFEALDNFYQLL